VMMQKFVDEMETKMYADEPPAREQAPAEDPAGTATDDLMKRLLG